MKENGKNAKSQSAMEYLMTYGWAILIIAVILGALYQVGVFNPYTFSPKATAGSCKVARGIVDGQVTSSKVGTCNNALPQYVASFTGQGYSYVSIGSAMANWYPQSTYTLSMWVEPSALSGVSSLFGNLENGASGYTIYITSSLIKYIAYGSAQGASATPAFYTNIWYNIGVVSSNNVFTFYINGAPQATTYSSWNAISSYGSTLTTRMGYTWVYPFNGFMANVQVYNSSLSSNEMQALYKEGVGGSPTNTANLTGWWPLNGDANDYSGNGNNGTPTNVVFTGSWMTGYSAP